MLINVSVSDPRGNVIQGPYVLHSACFHNVQVPSFHLSLGFQSTTSLEIPWLLLLVTAPVIIASASDIYIQCVK